MNFTNRSLFLLLEVHLLLWELFGWSCWVRKALRIAVSFPCCCF